MGSERRNLSQREMSRNRGSRNRKGGERKRSEELPDFQTTRTEAGSLGER